MNPQEQPKLLSLDS